MDAAANRDLIFISAGQRAGMELDRRIDLPAIRIGTLLHVVVAEINVIRAH
jgi:hypothetical protein